MALEVKCCDIKSHIYDKKLWKRSQIMRLKSHYEEKNQHFEIKK